MKVETLLKYIEDRELLLPEFQRDFVWKRDDVKNSSNHCIKIILQGLY